MKFLPVSSSLAWVGHGHLHKPLCTLIVYFSMNAASAELLYSCHTTFSPQCKKWYLTRNHFACHKHWHSILVCLAPWHLHTDVEHREGSAYFTKVFHGQARHARGIISHLDRVVSETAQEEEGILARSSFADWVVWDSESQACWDWDGGVHKIHLQHHKF